MTNNDYLDPDIHLWPLSEPEFDTDPYGNLTYVIGSEDDFWCFDYAVDTENELVQLHAVINSETGSFIEDAEKPIVVPFSEALDEAQRLVYAALDWCFVNEIEHDSEGWNQEPEQLINDIAGDIDHD